MPKTINGKQPAGKLWTHEELMAAISDGHDMSVRSQEEWLEAGYVNATWLNFHRGVPYRRALGMLQRISKSNPQAKEKVMVHTPDGARWVSVVNLNVVEGNK